MPVTLTEYAKRRGCSVKSVSRAAAAGRLVESVGRDARGQPTIIDPDLADREWAANTRQRADRLPAPPPARYGGADAGRIEPPLGSHSGPDGASPSPATPAFNVSRDLRAAAAARREAALADRAELELAAMRGKLVDADEIKADFAGHISVAKTRLLGLPARIAQEMPDLAERVVPVVDRLVRETLEELAADGRGA